MSSSSCPFRSVVLAFIVFLTYILSFLFTAPYVDLWHCPLNVFFSCTYLAYNILRTCTYIACSQICPPQHTHTCSPDLYPRATSVCVPLSHRLASLCHDLSHACIGMFENLILHPYCMDDLWTSFHHADMGHHMCHHRLTTLEFHLSYFLTP